ncbi:MAG: hypothetical protein QM686_17935 [Herbaspirillum sp.]|uniref:hypothetical protein n=1 Tax=Herbaspirillum huttiense TaxID=863372 RepID=UPI0031D904DE
MVKQTVTLADGSTQEVLVPQVYIHASNVQVTGQGTLIAGNDVAFQAAQDIVNSGGMIAGRQGVSADYGGGSIRLASCQTGACDIGFSQNLANKLGVPVTAPTDALFVFPNGRTVIGPNQFTNSGQWRTFYPVERN